MMTCRGDWGWQTAWWDKKTDRWEMSSSSYLAYLLPQFLPLYFLVNLWHPLHSLRNRSTYRGGGRSFQERKSWCRWGVFLFVFINFQVKSNKTDLWARQDSRGCLYSHFLTIRFLHARRWQLDDGIKKRKSLKMTKNVNIREGYGQKRRYFRGKVWYSWLNWIKFLLAFEGNFYVSKWENENGNLCSFLKFYFHLQKISQRQFKGTADVR